MNTAIEVQNFSLKKGSFLLDRINLYISEGEIFALLGKTGAGKTLLLESIAGFYKGDSGSVSIKGISVLDIPLTERKIGFVYQDCGLFPHMTAGQNIAYGLKMRKTPKPEIAQKVGEISELMSIDHILNQYPATLSGGEKQRTALARSLILNPQVLLLDEPFSALDPVTKDRMYNEIKRIHETFSCAIVFVTHDFVEASKLAERVGVMQKGRLEAIRESKRLFEPYENEELNRFFGIGGSNDELAGTDAKAEGRLLHNN